MFSALDGYAIHSSVDAVFTQSFCVQDDIAQLGMQKRAGDFGTLSWE